MSDRNTRYNAKQQAAAGTSAQKPSSVPPPPSRGKAKETADMGTSDVGSEESAKAETPLDPQATFSADQIRYVRDVAGRSTSMLDQRLSGQMAQMQDAIDDIGNLTSSLEHRLENATSSLERRMDDLFTGIMSKLDSIAVRKDPAEDLDPQNGRIRIKSNANRSSQAAGSGDNQDLSYLPAEQRFSVPFGTTAQGSSTNPKQEQRGSSLQIPDQQYRDDYRRSPSPYHRSNTVPPNPSATSVRWRPEDLGYFNGQKDDVHTWVDRIRELVALKGSPVVQANLSLSLREEAENWYHHELTKQQKWELLDPESGIEPWIAALTHRFEMDPVEILAKLNKQRYTRADAAAGKDPIEHLHTVMKLTRNRSTAESLYEAYMRIDSIWQLSLVAPTSTTTIEDFVKQLNAKKAAWYSEAKRMDSKDSYRYQGNKPWDQSASRQPTGDTRYSNGNGKWQGYQRNEKQSYRNDHPRDHFRQPPPNPGDIGPRVHHAAPLVPLLPPPRGEDQDDADDPDVWHADTGYGHGCSDPACQHWHGNH